MFIIVEKMYIQIYHLKYFVTPNSEVRDNHSNAEMIVTFSSILWGLIFSLNQQ